jgi:hypothetical protein
LGHLICMREGTTTAKGPVVVLPTAFSTPEY